MRKVLLTILAIYLSALAIHSFPYQPEWLGLTDFNCERFRRVDYIFPARQIQCFLGADVETLKEYSCEIYPGNGSIIMFKGSYKGESEAEDDAEKMIERLSSTMPATVPSNSTYSCGER